ncbi:MAG TPA: N-acetyl-gamma-glutamyl-phosphate reductase [Longimicrobiales bacterium]|nr:N-acetyl-gamma-glutamyl-phosphate reductase [Longimicrobiales bacterium]
MMHNNPFRAAILGATGYTGQELVALLARHPRLRATFVSSESEAGQPAAGSGLRYRRVEEVPLGEVDVVFSCLPHGEAEGWVLKARSAGARVVDLSADLRDGRHGAVYGLPELWREQVRGADLVANPGCYPTGILLGLAPLLGAGVLDGSRPIMIDAASGVTGAGRVAKRDLLFGEVAEDYRAYATGNTHRHVPEIARGLSAVAGRAVEFVFTPHLLPVRRGILETMHVPVAAGVSAADVVAGWNVAYAAEPFVEVWPEGLPTLRTGVQRNVVALGASDVIGVEQPLVLVVAAFDNLVKGAAGQALQNANLMLGVCEHEGLSR